MVRWENHEFENGFSAGIGVIMPIEQQRSRSSKRDFADACGGGKNNCVARAGYRHSYPYMDDLHRTAAGWFTDTFAKCLPKCAKPNAMTVDESESEYVNYLQTTREYLDDERFGTQSPRMILRVILDDEGSDTEATVSAAAVARLLQNWYGDPWPEDVRYFIDLLRDDRAYIAHHLLLTHLDLLVSICVNDGQCRSGCCKKKSCCIGDTSDDSGQCAPPSECMGIFGGFSGDQQCRSRYQKRAAVTDFHKLLNRNKI